MAETSVPGLEDVTGLARWLADNGLPGAGKIPVASLIAGGRSNLTYRLDFPGGEANERPRADAGARPSLVLRRPPLGHVLPTAHDMSREYRVLTALYGTAVPVPRPVALCQAPEVIGAPFYLMEYVEGRVLRTRDDAKILAPDQAGLLSRRFIEMLAIIHGVDVNAVGLAGFGRPQGYLARQLARWQRQWELSVTRPMPGYEDLTRRLAAGLPDDAVPGSPAGAGPEGQEPAATGAGVLVHGDFRLDNMLVTPGAEPGVAAVLDWEMSTLGDPLADLGLALVYWTDPGEESVLVLSGGASATTGPGFLTRVELADAYAGITGRDLSRLGYYMAFGCFKLAVVLEGIHARFLQRKTVGEGFEREGEAVPILINRAHELLDAGL